MTIEEFNKYIKSSREQIIKLNKIYAKIDYILTVSMCNYFKDFVDAKDKLKEAYRECPEECKEYFIEQTKSLINVQIDTVRSITIADIQRLFEEETLK